MMRKFKVKAPQPPPPEVGATEKKSIVLDVNDADLQSSNHS